MGDKELTAEQKQALEREIERKIRSKAKRKVFVKLGFMWHLAMFFIIMVGLTAINLTQSPNYLWVLWVLGGWGGAVLIHAFATFSMGSITEDMIQAEIEREKRRRGLI
jgi:hypothetical protein